MNQPMALATALFALGILLGSALPASPIPLTASALTSALAAAFRSQNATAWLAASLVLAGWARFAQATTPMRSDDLRLITDVAPQLVTVRGVLVESPQPRFQQGSGKSFTNSHATLRVRSLTQSDQQTILASGNVRVTVSGLLPGFYRKDEVVVQGILREPAGPAAPGLFDYRHHLSLSGIHRELRTSSIADWRHAEPIPPRSPPWDDKFLAWARKTTTLGLPTEDDELRLLWAMNLGWRSALTDELREPFTRSGTLHIFAISGLHVALLAHVFVQVLRLLLVPRPAAGGIVLPTLWLYIAATGWQPSAIRSGLMSSVVILSWMLYRPVDLLNSLAVAGFLFLAWDPPQLLQPGFQLSFSVVAAIGLLGPPLVEFSRRLTNTDPFLPDELVPIWKSRLCGIAHKLLVHVGVSIAAWIGSLPLTASHFHLVTPGGLVANLLVVPLSTLALASQLASLAVGSLLPPVAELFNHGAWFWMHLMLRISRWTASFPLASWHVETPPISASIAFYATLICIARRSRIPPTWRRRTVATLAFLLISIPVELRCRHPDSRLTLLPMRGGHAAVLETPDGVFVVDSGDARGFRELLEPYLRCRGVNQLDELVLTHGDLRHIGGATNLLQRFPVARVTANPAPFRSKAYRELMAFLGPRIASKPHSTAWQILHPTATDRFSRADDAAFVLLREWCGLRILLLADLGREGQERLMARHPNLRADIVITGIPEVGEPVCDGLLDQLRPRWLFVADSDTPATARTRPETIERLRRRGIRVWYTGSTGSLELRFDRGGVQFSDAYGTTLAPSFAAPDQP